MSVFVKPIVLDAVSGLYRNIAAGETLNAAIQNPETVSRTNGESGSVVKCAPVYLQAVNTVKKAIATGLATARVSGLVADTTIAASAVGNVITDGPLVATTGQWDAVTGATGGLTPLASYFLSETVGMLTDTPPTATGSAVTPIGQAQSTTELLIKIGQPILL